MIMTVAQLEQELEMMEIPNELYSIMVGGLPNEKLCLVKEETWQVYYSERGKKKRIKSIRNRSGSVRIFLEKNAKIRFELMT